MQYENIFDHRGAVKFQGRIVKEEPGAEFLDFYGLVVIGSVLHADGEIKRVRVRILEVVAVKLVHKEPARLGRQVFLGALALRRPVDHSNHEPRLELQILVSNPDGQIEGARIFGARQKFKHLRLIVEVHPVRQRVLILDTDLEGQVRVIRINNFPSYAMDVQRILVQS